MTDTKRLEEKIKESGITKVHIGKKLNLTPYGLSKKIKGITEFKAEEISRICKILNIADLQEKEDIFFAKLIDSKSTKTA